MTQPLTPSSPPLAKRLNRNALTVAAVLMGMTVITSVIVFNTSSHRAAEAAPPSGPSEMPPVRPTFLDQPARIGHGNPPSSGMGGPMAADSGSPHGVPGTATFPWTLDPNNPNSQRNDTDGPVTEPLREQRYLAALGSSAVANTTALGPANTPDDGTSGLRTPPPRETTATLEDRLLAFSDSLMRTSVGAATGGSAPTPLRPNSGRRAFLQNTGDLGGRSVIARLEPAGSPYTLRAGTVIPGMLVTAVTSDLPGECVGQVTRDVYDSKTQRILLIPKGAKLICRYDDQLVAGQGRLLIAWTRLLLPDGRSMTLPGLALKDPQGQTGAVGQVNNHTGRVFGRALLLSAISAGVQLSQPRQGSVLATPSAGQVAAGAVGQELSNVALEILRRGMDQPPTITVPQGQLFNVFLNGDLVFDGAYTPQQ